MDSSTAFQVTKQIDHGKGTKWELPSVSSPDAEWRY